jgi:hypothetical protein
MANMFKIPGAGPIHHLVVKNVSQFPVIVHNDRARPDMPTGIAGFFFTKLPRMTLVVGDLVLGQGEKGRRCAYRVGHVGKRRYTVTCVDIKGAGQGIAYHFAIFGAGRFQQRVPEQPHRLPLKQCTEAAVTVENGGVLTYSTNLANGANDQVSIRWGWVLTCRFAPSATSATAK